MRAGQGRSRGNTGGHADAQRGQHDDRHGDGNGHEHSHPEGRLRERIAALVRPHSHDPGEATDDALEASTEGIRAVKVSLAGLGVTAIVQLAIYAASGSVALLADTIHNFSDALTAIPLWIAFRLGRRVDTERYTYGYGRAEDLAGLFIVGMIALSAGLAAWEAFRRLLAPQDITHVAWVIAAGMVGALGNEAVARYRIRVGRRIGSAALVADGLHARTDGLTSVAVAGGALGVALGFPLADPLVGLGIAAAIMLILARAARDIFGRLMDRVDPALVRRVRAVAAGVDGVGGVGAVRLRWVGNQLRAELDIRCDAATPLTTAHQIAVAVEHRLIHDVPRLHAASIHVDPMEGRHHDVLAHHR